MNKVASGFKSFPLNDIIAGVLSGVVVVMISMAVSAVIFKGQLVSYFAIGVTCALIGSCIMNTFNVTFSSFPFGIWRPEPVIGVILGIMFTNIANHISPTSSLLLTLAIALMLTSLMTGIVMLVMGYFRLGQITRFLPYPALCGIIISMGWFTAQASFFLMSNQPFHFNTFLHHDAALQYLLWLGFGIYLLCINKISISRLWLLPFSVLIAALITNMVLQYYHVSHLEAIQKNWLFAPFKPEFIFKSLSPSSIIQIDWSAIQSQIGYLASLIGIIILMSLFNTSSLETIYKKKTNLERELKLSGISNLLNSLVVGIPSNLSVSGTVLNKNAGASKRISGITTSVICLSVLFIFPDFISYLPKPIIAGILLYVSISLMLDWLFVSWKRLPYIDYFIIVSIVIVAAVWGFLTGVMVGIIIACISFVIRFARISVIKFAITGENFRSNVIRPLDQQNWLVKQGGAIQIFKLQGYIFFGSAKLLLDMITKIIDEDKENKLKFLIFDFQLVTGIDSSASYTFLQLQQLTRAKHLYFLFTHCSASLLQQFKYHQVINLLFNAIEFPDLDQGIAWCEDQLLKSIPIQHRPRAMSLENTLNLLFPDKNQLTIFKSFLEKISTPAQFLLLKQGDLVDVIYFIELGEVAIFLKNEHSSIRLAKSGPGTIVGEIAFFLHIPRTATVITETPCVIYKLSEGALRKLEKLHPEIALTFHKNIIHTLASRVVQTSQALKLMSQ